MHEAALQAGDATDGGSAPRAATLVYRTAGDPGTLHAVSLSNPDLRRELTPEFRATGARVRWLAYSPDGAFVAHLSQTEPGRTDLYLRATRGKELQRLSASLGTAQSPSFSPNSRWLAFVAARSATDPQTVLQLVDLAQSPPRITDLGSTAQDAPLWSGDSRIVAFKTAPNVLRSVRVADARRAIDIPVAGSLSPAILSHDGRFVAWLSQGNALVARTDQAQPARTMQCPAGHPISFAGAGKQDVLLQCRETRSDSWAVCSLAMARCHSLSPLVPGPQCGQLQILNGPDAIYSVWLAGPRWQAPTLLARVPGGRPPFARVQAFSRDCASLVYAPSPKELARIRLTPSGQAKGEQRAELTVQLDRWASPQIWPSPDGEVALLATESGLSLLRWSSAQTTPLEPHMSVGAGAGWIDNANAVFQGRTTERGWEHLLFKVSLTDRGSKVRMLIDEDLKAGAQRESHGFTLAPDGRSALLSAGAGKRDHPAFAQAGSGDVPLLYDLMTEQLEALIPRPSADTGKLLEVVPMGTHAVAFTAAVNESWQALSFVDDLRERYPLAASLANSNGHAVVSPDGLAAAFHSAERLDLLRLAPAHKREAPRVHSVALSIDGGKFTGDTQWFVARTYQNDLYAVATVSGEVRPLAHSVRHFAVAPVGSAIAFAQDVGDGRTKLRFLELRKSEPVFVDLWEDCAFQSEWFSEDGTQLAYTGSADDRSMFSLKMWRVGAPGAGQVRGTYRAGASPARDGPPSRSAEASVLRGERGLLVISGAPYYLDKRPTWLLPWLGARASPWQLPTDFGILDIRQVGDSELLVANEATPSHSRLRLYRLGAPRALATLAELDSNTELIAWFQLSPSGAHLVYATRRELYLRAVHDAAAQPVKLTRFSSDTYGHGFSPDGRYFALREVQTGRRATLYVVDVEQPSWRQISSAEHDVRSAFWLDSPDAPAQRQAR
jgi:hypothetical protein